MFNYCIPSVNNLNEFCKSSTEFGQLTLNSRVFPSKRNILSHLNNIPDKSILIHYDYIYIISRYIFFSTPVKQAILEEINSILLSPKVKGIVMHTDFPLRKEVIKNPTADLIKKYYSKPLYNKESIFIYLNTYCVLDFLEESIRSFYLDFTNRFGLPDNLTPIYLENTTKINSHFINYGTLDNLILILEHNPFLKKLFGICIDTEHDYAVTGRYITNFIPYTSLDINIVVHLNTIPTEVKPKSCLDRHSNTTIFECSLNSPEIYKSIETTYCDLDIIREVNYTTMQREIKQLSNNN